MVKSQDVERRALTRRLADNIEKLLVGGIGLGIVWLINGNVELNKGQAILQKEVAANHRELQNSMRSTDARQLDFEGRTNDRLADHETRIRVLERVTAAHK